MSEEHGVSRAAMDKHFAKAGIERDLTKRIQDKADALVAQAAVTQGVTPATTRIEKDVVDANADLQVHVRMGHRKDIGRARNLFSRLLDELELTTDNRALFEQLGEMLDGSAPGKPDKLNEIYRKVISMTGRVDSAKKLTEMLEKVVRLEREAFGIDKDQDTENPVDKEQGWRPGAIYLEPGAAAHPCGAGETAQRKRLRQSAVAERAPTGRLYLYRCAVLPPHQHHAWAFCLHRGA